MIKPYLELGPLKLHYYGLIIAAAIYIGLKLAQKRSAFYKIPAKLFDDLVIFTPLFLALIGGRAYHVLDKWSVYSQNPASIFYVSNGGLGIWGGLAGLIVGAYLVSKLKKINFLSFMDVISPSVLLAQALGRIGNFINQEGFGPPTQKPWGVYIDEIHRPIQYAASKFFHPTFFYEAIINLVFFIILVKITKQAKKPGQMFGFYLISYSVGRFIVEFWRMDTWQIGEFKIAQVLSVIAFTSGVYLVLSVKKKGA